MQGIEILYSFSKKIVFENLLVGPLKLGAPSVRGPRVQSILAYSIYGSADGTIGIPAALQQGQNNTTNNSRKLQSLLFSALIITPVHSESLTDVLCCISSGIPTQMSLTVTSGATLKRWTNSEKGWGICKVLTAVKTCKLFEHSLFPF